MVVNFDKKLAERTVVKIDIKKVHVYNIEWYIPSDVANIPDLPKDAYVSLLATLDEGSVQANVILRNLIQYFGFVPQAFSYRSLKDDICGYRDWQLSDSRLPTSERDRLAAKTKSHCVDSGCYGSGSYACLNLCKGC